MIEKAKKEKVITNHTVLEDVMNARDYENILKNPHNKNREKDLIEYSK